MNATSCYGPCRLVRVTISISSLRGGGAERVAVNMANYWAAKGWKITILTDSQGVEPPAYALSPEVEHHDLRLADGGPARPDRQSIIESGIAFRDILRDASPPERNLLMLDLNLIARYRQALKQSLADAVIAIIDLTNIRVLLATMEMDVPVLVSEQIDPRFNDVGPAVDRLRRRVYP